MYIKYCIGHPNQHIVFPEPKIKIQQYCLDVDREREKGTNIDWKVNEIFIVYGSSWLS